MGNNVVTIEKEKKKLITTGKWNLFGYISVLLSSSPTQLVYAREGWCKHHVLGHLKLFYSHRTRQWRQRPLPCTCNTSSLSRSLICSPETLCKTHVKTFTKTAKPYMTVVYPTLSVCNSGKDICELQPTMWYFSGIKGLDLASSRPLMPSFSPIKSSSKTHTRQ